MDEFTRAATLDDLKTLLRSLESHGIEYLLIGGYALAAHGYQRATTDIDVMVKGTAEVGERMKSALMVLPDRVAKDIEPEWFNEGENIRVSARHAAHGTDWAKSYRKLMFSTACQKMDGKTRWGGYANAWSATRNSLRYSPSSLPRPRKRARAKAGDFILRQRWCRVSE